MELYEARQNIRYTQEKVAEKQLEESLQKKPSLGMLLAAKQETSRLLREYTEEDTARSMIRLREQEKRASNQRHLKSRERER